MEFTDILAAVAIGVLIGVAAIMTYCWILYQRLRNRIDQMIEQIITEAEADLVGLDIEIDNGVYFCYNTEDKQFVCQGTTVAEIKHAFQDRFPGKTAYLAGGDPGVIAEFKIELLKLATNENSTGQ